MGYYNNILNKTIEKREHHIQNEKWEKYINS